jgi:hypothetical protein
MVLRLFMVTEVRAMEMIEFEWSRCIDGYRISKDGEKIETASHRFEPYRPTAFPVLFQTFIDTPTNNQGALDFSEKFGGLGFRGEGTTSLELFFERQEHLRQASELAESSNWTTLVDRFNTDEYGRSSRGFLKPQLRHQPRGKVVLVFVPTNLIQFLWLQFALHLGSGAKLLRCERCGSPFTVGTGTGRRETAKFCSNACKVAAFRNRHAQGIAHA